MILFDGDCAMCNRALSFIAPRIPREVDLSFAPINSVLGKTLLAGRARVQQRDALVYLDVDELLQGAAAVQRVLSFMPGWRIAARVLAVLPDVLTESAYDLVAAHRYRLNRRLTACDLPSAALAARLVSQPREVP